MKLNVELHRLIFLWEEILKLHVIADEYLEYVAMTPHVALVRSWQTMFPFKIDYTGCVLNARTRTKNFAG